MLQGAYNQQACGCSARSGRGRRIQRAAGGRVRRRGSLGLLRRRRGRPEFREHRTGLDDGRRRRGKIAGIADHWTGTVTGWNLGLAKVTEKPASGGLHAGPSEVVASAPGGADSSATFTDQGKIVKERLTPGVAVPNTHNKSDGYVRGATLLRLSTAAGRSRIWPISRSGFSSAIGTSV
jgi:hypothetical protein